MMSVYKVRLITSKYKVASKKYVRMQGALK